MTKMGNYGSQVEFDSVSIWPFEVPPSAHATINKV
jgi:hypothetical protein